MYACWRQSPKVTSCCGKVILQGTGTGYGTACCGVGLLVLSENEQYCYLRLLHTILILQAFLFSYCCSCEHCNSYWYLCVCLLATLEDVRSKTRICRTPRGLEYISIEGKILYTKKAAEFGSKLAPWKQYCAIMPKWRFCETWVIAITHTCGTYHRTDRSPKAPGGYAMIKRSQGSCIRLQSTPKYSI